MSSPSQDAGHVAEFLGDVSDPGLPEIDGYIDDVANDPMDLENINILFDSDLGLTPTLKCTFKFEKASQWKSVEVEFSMLDLADLASTFTFLQGCPLLNPVARWALGHPAAMISLEDPRGTGSRPKALDGDKCWHKASPSWNIPFGRASDPPPPTELFLFLNCPVPGCNDIKFATPAEAVTIANELPQLKPNDSWQCAGCRTSSTKKKKTADNNKRSRTDEHGSRSPGGAVSSDSSAAAAASGWDLDEDAGKTHTSKNVGIDGHLAVQGQIQAHGGLIETSDQRLKDNIRRNTEGADAADLDRVRNLPPSYYDWMKGTANAGRRDVHGFIAQDVQAALGPDAVAEIGTTTLEGGTIPDTIAIRPGVIQATAVGAIRAQDRNVQQNTADIAEIRNDVDRNTREMAEMRTEIDEIRGVVETLMAQFGHLDQHSDELPASALAILRQFKMELVWKSKAVSESVGPAFWKSYEGPTCSPSPLAFVPVTINTAPSTSSRPATRTVAAVGNIAPSMDATDVAPVGTTPASSASGPTPLLQDNPNTSARVAVTKTPSQRTTTANDTGASNREASTTGSIATPAAAESGDLVAAPELREYQRFILNGVLQWYAAKPSDPTVPDVVAVVLPTGAGKTSIAFELLLNAVRQFPDRTAVFLAPKVVLVEQQAKRFSLRSDVCGLTVRILASGKGRFLCGSGAGASTGSHLGAQVVFATPAMYLSLFDAVSTTSIVPVVPASILILDESHHAKPDSQTKHPYRFAVDRAGPGTKVVGLTATPDAFLHRGPVVFTVKAGELGLCENRFEEVHLDVSALFPIDGAVMGDQLRQLDDFAKRAQRNNDALLVKSATKARRIYRNIGWDQASDQIQADGGDPAVFGLSSPIQRSRILDVVATVLREARGRPIDREPQAILYVDHKESARLLKDELDQICRTGPKALRWIRPGLILGTGQSKTSSGQVLDDFRELRVNVLVATSCIREGLDVPGCNIVIAVEPPHSKLDNIQLKGRARARHAKYVVICHDDEQWREFNSMVSQPDEHLPVAAASQANENDTSDTASVISATSDDAVIELAMNLPCSGSGKESVGKQHWRSEKEELELAMALSLSEAQPRPSASARSRQHSHTASGSAAGGGGDCGDGGGNGGNGDARSFVAEGVTDDAGAPKRWPTEQKARKAWCRQRFGFGWQQQVDVQVKRSRLASAVVYPA